MMCTCRAFPLWMLLCLPAYGCAPLRAQTADQRASDDLADARAHLAELRALAKKIAPAAAQARLQQEIHRAAPEAAEGRHAKSAKAKARGIGAPARGLPLLEVNKTLQVLETHSPAFSITGITPRNPGLSSLSACNGGSDYYPELSQGIVQHATRLRALSESVGRIERKIGSDPPQVLGTAFVVDAKNGLVATACHVVDAIAAFQPDTQRWVFRSSPGSLDTVVLLDFGWTTGHEPDQEFRVESVQFVPALEGCDGALLKVDTLARPLPPELPTGDIGSPFREALNAMVIGYPGEPATQDTEMTRRYFTCIRAAAAPGTAKFAFGGAVTRIEGRTDYRILAHVVPTVAGQSGSPVLDASDLNHPRVIGIHICCARAAVNPFGIACEHRNEKFLQEAISLADLMRLYGRRAALDALPPRLFGALRPAPACR